MRKCLVLTLFFSLLLSGCSLPFLPQAKSGLYILSSPNAGVFLDGNQVGSTPYKNEKIKAATYQLKIVPEDGIGQAWESQINLLPGIMTTINRQLGETSDLSGGYALTMEKDPDPNGASIAVVSEPDRAVVNLDGEARGFTPILISKISAGEHVIVVSAPGYIDRTINANIKAGYRLNINVQLVKSFTENQANPESTISATPVDNPDEEVLDAKNTPTPSPTAKASTGKPDPVTELDTPYVQVLDTPTGFLNVRQDPNTYEDNIIAKIKPGEKYPYLDRNNSGWYQIELDDNTKGWVSSKYVKLFE